MRTLSQGFLSFVNAQSTGEAVLALVTLKLTTPIHVVNNTTQIISNGVAYDPYWFDITLNDDTANGIRSVSLQIDNTDRRIVEAIRATTTPIEVRIQIVLSSTPNVVEIDLDGLILRNVQYDENTVSGDLIFEERLGNAIPRHTFSPVLFEGIFR